MFDAAGDRVVRVDPVGQVTQVGDAADVFDVRLAVAPNGTVYATTRLDRTHRSDRGPGTQLATGPGDDLYFLQPDSRQVRVLVRPAHVPAISGGVSFTAPPGWVTFLVVVARSGWASTSGSDAPDSVLDVWRPVRLLSRGQSHFDAPSRRREPSASS